MTIEGKTENHEMLVKVENHVILFQSHNTVEPDVNPSFQFFFFSVLKNNGRSHSFFIDLQVTGVKAIKVFCSSFAFLKVHLKL